MRPQRGLAAFPQIIVCGFEALQLPVAKSPCISGFVNPWFNEVVTDKNIEFKFYNMAHGPHFSGKKDEGLHFYTRIGTKLLETQTCLN